MLLDIPLILLDKSPILLGKSPNSAGESQHFPHQVHDDAQICGRLAHLPRHIGLPVEDQRSELPVLSVRSDAEEAGPAKHGTQGEASKLRMFMFNVFYEQKWWLTRLNPESMIFCRPAAKVGI